MAVIVSLFRAQGADDPKTSNYTEAMFRSAFDNESTAPDFILVSVRAGQHAEPVVRCIEAPFLEGAIHTEFGIGYDEPRKVRAMALGYFSKVLTLSKPKAIENVEPRYTPQQLANARQMLEGATAKELVSYEYINGLCGYKINGEKPKLDRDAVAHVLLERGIPCVRGCFAGDLTPNPKRHK